MRLLCYRGGVLWKEWQVDLPEPDPLLGDRENFEIRERVVTDMISERQVEYASQLTLDHYFRLSVESKFPPVADDQVYDEEPKPFSFEVTPLPIVRVEGRPPAIYSNRSPYKIAK